MKQYSKPIFVTVVTIAVLIYYFLLAGTAINLLEDDVVMSCANEVSFMPCTSRYISLPVDVVGIVLMWPGLVAAYLVVMLTDLVNAADEIALIAAGAFLVALNTLYQYKLVKLILGRFGPVGTVAGPTAENP